LEKLGEVGILGEYVEVGIYVLFAFEGFGCFIEDWKVSIWN
jgi:hypothetical protein